MISSIYNTSMRSGLVLINNDNHQLFCQLYGIKYDQLGFVHDGLLRLYWMIPTEKESYHGAEDKFELKGAVIYHALLNTSRCSKNLFERSLQRLTDKIKIPFDQQYQKGTPLGVSYVNRVIETLTPALQDSLSSAYIAESSFLESFFPPVIYRKNREVVPIHCTDLIDAIMRNPEPAMLVRERRLKYLASEAANALTDILTISRSQGKKIIKATDLAVYGTLASQLKQCLLKQETTVEGEDREDGDQILVIEADGSFYHTLQQFRRELRQLLRPQMANNSVSPIIDAQKLLTITNQIFSFLGLRAIKEAWTPETVEFSYLIAVVNKEEREDEGVVALSGQGLEKLNQRELAQLLQRLSLYEDNHDFDMLREEATKRYYQLSQPAETQ